MMPFSIVVGWMYMAQDQVGDSTSNPFEGSANDVPISQIGRAGESELRDILGEAERSNPIQALNGIIV